MSQDVEPASTLDVTVNGEPESLRYREGDTLMQTLRRGGYYSVKNGCSEGVCGSCNVMYGEQQIVRACLVPADRYQGEDLITAEGLVGDGGALHPVQQAFLDHGAAQCGFCIPGMILTAAGLLERNPNPSDGEIRRALRGNICRCTGYIQQFEAIRSAADAMQTGAPDNTAD